MSSARVSAFADDYQFAFEFFAEDITADGDGEGQGFAFYFCPEGSFEVSGDVLAFVVGFELHDDGFFGSTTVGLFRFLEFHGRRTGDVDLEGNSEFFAKVLDDLGSSFPVELQALFLDDDFAVFKCAKFLNQLLRNIDFFATDAQCTVGSDEFVVSVRVGGGGCRCCKDRDE